MLSGTETVPPSDWAQVILQEAAIVTLRCTPVSFVLGPEFKAALMVGRAKAFVPGNQSLVAVPESPPMPCGRPISPDTQPQCWPASSCVRLIDLAFNSVFQPPASAEWVPANYGIRFLSSYLVCEVQADAACMSKGISESRHARCRATGRLPACMHACGCVP